MLNQAAIVNGNFIVTSHSKTFYEGDYDFSCNAITMVFLKSRREEVIGGTLFANGCPGINEASMIIAAKLKKVVLNREPENSEELCAVEALKESNVEVVLNQNIFL